MEQYARYRAPAESGQKLVSPSLRELPSLVAGNRDWRASSDLEIAGQPLPEFAAEARRELLAAAAEYVASYDADRHVSSGPQLSEAPLILTGHQPELIHPGVWVKNFAAAQLASSLGGAALNLIIDADACRGTSLRVPSGSADQPTFASVEYDSPSGTVPWEERGIVDRELWQGFPQRVQQATSMWLSERMLDSWWPTVVSRGEATGRIGAAFAQGRHLAELEWGQDSLELPQNRMCQTRAFRRFTLCLLAELPRFAAAYNGALDEYRHTRRIRNHAHPVSNLATDGAWLQAPFWVWSSVNPKRRAVYVRRDAAGLVITDREQFERQLPLSCGEDAERAIAVLQEIEADGTKLRSRALVTTMFARMVVADLFIHGIGGAKYDEATDSIIRRFFQTAPPAFATISGTLRPPLHAADAAVADAGQLRHGLRELEFHPERRVAHNGDPANGESVDRLVAEKRRWIAMAKSPETARRRHLGIAAANEALQPFVARQRIALEAELQAASDQSRAARVLRSREFAFCLFPREVLAEFLLDFSSGVL